MSQNKGVIKRGKYFGWGIKTIRIINPVTHKMLGLYHLNEEGKITSPAPRNIFPKRKLEIPKDEDHLTDTSTSSSTPICTPVHQTIQPKIIPPTMVSPSITQPMISTMNPTITPTSSPETQYVPNQIYGSKETSPIYQESENKLYSFGVGNVASASIIDNKLTDFDFDSKEESHEDSSKKGKNQIKGVFDDSLNDKYYDDEYFFGGNSFFNSELVDETEMLFPDHIFDFGNNDSALDLL
ncbi:hypothetical protein TRFO_21903 [Tritrichomonas foetus]|uniref:Uncharacterized protein n=1 Tax=Tritrichomonas foetus TaxID=1144522 RepID=A0A1J4KHX5_9EUKA|nr:hypothetical protein TRFO_21903 [Tritrichomonas foetus]|eukprot:OHT09254.1 hypothetical protein TRFO_21903 [Tritrichomonas foetus]